MLCSLCLAGLHARYNCSLAPLGAVCAASYGLSRMQARFLYRYESMEQVGLQFCSCVLC